MFEKKVESLLLSARWLLAPFYALLLITLIPLFVMSFKEVLHLFPAAMSGLEADVVLIVLSMLDLVLLANLIMMVAVSSFESYISRIEAGTQEDRPEWLGKLDSGGVKVKVAVSIAMIAAVHLLRDFMKESDPRQLLIPAGVLLVFVTTAFVMSRTGGAKYSQ